MDDVILLLVFGVLSIGCIVLACVLLTFGFLDRTETRKTAKYLEQLEDSTELEGVITDAAVVQDNKPLPYHYKYALMYQDSQMQPHRAFLGISTKHLLQFAVGQSIRLRVLKQPLLDVPDDAVDIRRGGDGRLPGKIRFRMIHGVPVDETSTLMLAADYHILYNKYMNKQRRQSRNSKGMLIAGGVSSAGALACIGCVVYFASQLQCIDLLMRLCGRF